MLCQMVPLPVTLSDPKPHNFPHFVSPFVSSYWVESVTSSVGYRMGEVLGRFSISRSLATDKSEASSNFSSQNLSKTTPRTGSSDKTDLMEFVQYHAAF